MQTAVSNERSRQILEAARAAFAAGGYAATSMGDIARRVGIAEGGIYHHFASKRELLAAVIRDWYEPNIARLGDTIAGIAGGRARFRFLVWAQLSAFTRQPGLCRIVIGEARAMPDYLGSEIAELNRRYTALVVSVVAAAQEAGELRSDLPATMVRDVVFGGIEHLAWKAVNGAGTIDAERLADELTTLLWDGLAPRAGGEPAGRLAGQLDRLERLLDRGEIA